MISGLNRNRKNAITAEDLSDRPAPEGKVGRPSKGGDLKRSQRYYFNHQLKILQKRKLKRYIAAVKKHADRHLYEPEDIKNELENFCARYKHRDKKHVSYDTILRAIDLGREDRYLVFLEEGAQTILGSLPIEVAQSEIESVLSDLANKHITRLFQLSTLWSAYLLAHWIQNQPTDSSQKRIDSIKLLVEDHYIVAYSHLQGQELPEGFITTDRWDDIF